MSDITDVLKDLGFENREIQIYPELIKESNLTALEISKKTTIDRTTVYDILEKLMHKGIVSTRIINNSKHFSALLPKQLLAHFKEKYSSLETILPELNKITNEKQDVVKCELFHGREGLKTVFKDIITRGKDYKAIGIRKEYEEIIGYFTEHAISKLNIFKAKEIGIVEKGIKFSKLKNSEYRYLDKKNMPSVTTIIYDDKSIFIIWVEPYFAIRITNKTFEKAQDEYFKFMWLIAKN